MMMKVDNGEKTHNIQCFDNDDMAFEGVTIDVSPTLEKNDYRDDMRCSSLILETNRMTQYDVIVLGNSIKSFSWKE